MSRLAITALAQEDESLFSWLSRFAALQDMTARQLLACYELSLPEDPDRIYKEHFFQKLADTSGQELTKLKNLGVARYHGILFEQDNVNPLLP